MLLEIINELLNELSPFYCYLSVFISIVYLERIRFEWQQHGLENQLYIRKCHEVEFRLLPKQKCIPRIIEIRNWITTKTKRIEAPDDDSEAPSFSFIHSIQLRGGKQWKQNLYSLSLKNIA
ncbi:hypothetical protein [Oceanobacillus salinisoli]|uniref:hypothetical protein n=1 Tax=Oceanobacillus salinisoli TaxID=2678611 RepID=UPI0012E30868|nr:hypothetical protein [Oceanobacillus salinisoli]